jgi:two-component system, cell cycle sensor histidine kinase and response regulator CckA
MQAEKNAELKAAREALAASERRYRELVDLAPIGIFRSTRGGRFVSVNPALASLLGYDSPDEMLQLDLRADVYVVGAERDQRVSEREGAGMSGFDVRWKRRDGSPVWVHLDSRVIRGESGALELFEGFVYDIQERKDAEEALRGSEERYRLLFEKNPEPMWVFDEKTLAFLAVNEAACRHYGYSHEEFLGMTIRDIRPAEDVPALLKQIAGESRNHEEAGVWRHRRKGGTVIEVEITSDKLIFGEREAQLVLASDVTEKRQLEEQFRQAQKMEAVGQLAGGVAHDFNNVLTAILGYGSLLASRLASDASGREEVEEILRAAERAAALTRQLLAFSRRQVLEPVVLSINELITNFEKMLGRLIGEDVNLVTRLEPSLGNVLADAGQIEQVIANLVVNARDAMPQGGKLTIETANADLDEAYAQRHATVRPGRYVMVAVSDTGTGMDAETQAHIFEPFFTTKEKGKGTGLGLSTAYGIVKQSGGSIWVYSEPGKGTTFKVYLPRVEEAAPAAPPRSSDSLPALGTETILIVEDEPAVRSLSRQVLERSGYHVLEAGDGESALELVRAHPEPIHLLLTDLVMPDMGGTELASRLQDKHPAIRVLFMSGYTDDGVVRNGMLGSGRAFLQKPFTPAMLVRKIRDVFA